MGTLRTRTLLGLSWSAASQMVGQLWQIVITAILARLLSPTEYGLLGMVMVFTGFAAYFSDLSLGASIIQKRDVSKRHLDSVFWLNVVVGVVLTLLFGLAAPFVAKFYHEPSLRLLTSAVAVIFILKSLNVVQSALLDKSLDFRTRFWINMASFFISGALALTLAFKGAGVWSLVGQSLSAAAVQAAMMWRLSSWRPGLSFDLAAVKELMRFSNHLLGFNMVIYWSGNFDKLVIGRVLRSADLGLYSLASRLVLLPLASITGIAHKVMFPALLTMQDDRKAMKRVYLRANRMIALLTFPMMVGLSVLAEPAILTVYGNKWLGAVGIFQIMCFTGMLQSVYNTSAWIFLSLGKTQTLFRLGIYTTLVHVVGILIGIRWELEGAAWAYFFAGFLVGYPTWFAAGRLIDLRMAEILKNLIGPACCAASMGVFSDNWILAERPIWIRLVAQVPAGMLIYLFLIRRFRLQAWNDAAVVILEMGGRRSRFIRWLTHDVASSTGSERN
jgi:PST family polysaccharide transporter